MANNLTPVIINAEDIDFSIGEQVLLNKASLTVHEKERLALVGRNGAGKTTFLKIINEDEIPNQGHIKKKTELTVSYLPQYINNDRDIDIYSFIKEGLKDVCELLKEYEKLSPQSPKTAKLEAEITKKDGWNIKNKIESEIESLNIPDKNRKISSLSGGEKRKVHLAKVMISKPQLLILDEPTNHLDIDTVEWFEKYITSYQGTIIFVTHDRYFLDNLATRVVELEKGKFHSYEGNYSAYLLGKARREEQLEKEERKRQNFLRREINWIKSNPKARTGKSKARIKRFNEAANQYIPDKIPDMSLVIPKPRRLGNKVVDFEEVSFSYINDEKIINEFSFKFEPGTKLGVIGKNGVGKTTFLKLVTGELKPTEGDIKISPNVDFNYVDQERMNLNPENSVFNEIGEGAEFVNLGEEKITIWAYLKRFLFEDERIKTKVKRLSGGEKGRVMMAKILKKPANFIILDEPTNDLDLSTLRVLEEGLIAYKGCVLLVSHDRYFLNRVCNGIISFSAEEGMSYTPGNYDYYLQKINNEIKKNSLNDKTKKKDPKEKLKKKKNGVRKLTWKEKIELDEIEDKITNREERINTIENIFTRADFYEEFGARLQELQEEMNEKKKELEYLYNRWEELELIKNGMKKIEQ